MIQFIISCLCDETKGRGKLIQSFLMYICKVKGLKKKKRKVSGVMVQLVFYAVWFLFTFFKNGLMSALFWR